MDARGESLDESRRSARGGGGSPSVDREPGRVLLQNGHSGAKFVGQWHAERWTAHDEGGRRHRRPRRAGYRAKTGQCRSHAVVTVAVAVALPFCRPRKPRTSKESPTIGVLIVFNSGFFFRIRKSVFERGKFIRGYIARVYTFRLGRKKRKIAFIPKTVRNFI